MLSYARGAELPVLDKIFISALTNGLGNRQLPKLSSPAIRNCG